MKLTFLGATGTVTGSKTLFSIGGKNILIDCGLFQGLKALRLRNWEPFPIAPSRIDAVVLTHAHIDHSGYLPLLIKNGFSGPVYSTPSTRDLCAIMLPDSGHLQEEEARYANKHHISKHRPALPLYTHADGEQAIKSFQTVEFHRPFKIGTDIEITFLPAGHILGAAMVRVKAGGRSILFSGDLGRPQDTIMKAPEGIEETDYLLIESTYGNRRHKAEDVKPILADIVNRTVKRGGVIIVPAFAVGRAQALLYLIHLLKRDRKIPDIPVFLNSPMAIDATSIYCLYQDEHRLSKAECAALCSVARFVTTVEESKSLNALTSPAIIISASGMATGGRVIHHIKHYAPDPKNTILFTGYQAAGTRGQAIVDGAESVKIHGEHVPIGAEIINLDHLSAHADYEESLAWLSRFTRAPKMTYIVHGEPIAADALRAHIEERLHWACKLPEYLEAVML